jgi:SAM-dependent methyltransferase
MTGGDADYFKKCFDLGLIGSPFLEVGSAKVQGDVPNLCELGSRYGVAQVAGVDLEPGSGVNFTADFSAPAELFGKAWDRGRFATVAIFNVLEHTFDPIAILTNALNCVADGGTLLVLTPTVWPIHNFPRDYNRLLPDWYQEFGARSKLQLQRQAFCWVSQFGIVPVDELRDGDIYLLPTSRSIGKNKAPWRFWTSQAVHRLFNTFGRSHWFTHVALGVAYRR